MNLLTIDFETFYSKEFSLSKLTTEEYVRHPDFEVIGVAVQVNDGEPQWFSGTLKQTKRWLGKFDWDNSMALAHNAMFDMSILSWVFDIRPKRIADTLCMARAVHGSSVSVSLKNLADLYNVGVKGTEVINALGKRRIDFTEEEMEAYGSYCRNDVRLTYDLFSLLAPNFPPVEARLIDLTIRMFSEPVLELSKPALEDHLADVQAKKEALMSKLNYDKADLMSNPKLAELLKFHGVVPPTKISPTTGKETWAFGKNDEGFKALLEHENPQVQAIIAARMGIKSTLEETRTERFIQIADRGTLPIPLRYYAAHTGRWGGDDKVNMQNLPRKSPLKKAIKAPEGYVVVDCDSSQIEARTLAWLAGQDDLVAAFTAGEDVYRIMASAIYGKSVDQITDGERFVGKTTILGAGYGMGAAKFQAQLKTFNVEMSLEECQRIIAVYRETYPAIPELWKEAQKAVRALADDGEYWLGVNDLLHCKDYSIKLPNKLTLQYPNLRKHEDAETGKVEYVYDTKRGKQTVANRVYGGKCLGADTEVLTERGWVPIIYVTTADRLWDGIEWVSHSGLTYQGEKSTVILDGVKMTPDHKVLTEEGWRCASSCQGLHRAGFWLPDGSEVRGDKRAALDVGLPLRLRKRSDTYSNRHGKVYSARWHSVMRLHGRIKQQNAWYDKASCLLGMAFNARQMSITYASGMAQLRRTRDYGLSKMANIFRKLLGGYGSYVCVGAYAGSKGQQWQLYSRELSLGNAGSTGTEYTRCLTGRFKEGCSSNGYFTLDASVSVAPQPVYDLRNAGPRSRFVVRGISGAFIVHNCTENICQALARIIVGDQMLMIAKLYRVAMTVHDSVVALVPEDEAEEGRAYIESCMRIRPKWATGLPLNCESKMGLTYGG